MSNTCQINEVIKSLKKSPQSLGDYENSLSDYGCTIIACGPSLEKEKLKIIENRSRGDLIICIKQSMLFFEGQCHFHFNNFCNFQKYKDDPLTISCLAWWDENQKRAHPSEFLAADILFEIKTKSTISNLSRLLNQDGFNEVMRIRGNDSFFKGPGIMYECVFPLVHHLGTKNVTIFGWDIGNNKNSIDHFYNNEQDLNKQIKYKSGSYTGETNLIAAALPKVSGFFAEKDIEIKVVSHLNPMDSSGAFTKMTFKEWESQ